jgi:hypothetical protein
MALNNLQDAGHKRKRQDTYDVVDKHHSRNRKHRAPDVHRLHQSAAWQTGPESKLDSTDSDAAGSSTEAPVPKRAKRNSKRPYKSGRGDATQLQFYTGTWVDILELAKRHFRLYVASEMNYPERDKHLWKATDCLETSINIHKKKEGVVVEEGMSLALNG